MSTVSAKKLIKRMRQRIKSAERWRTLMADGEAYAQAHWHVAQKAAFEEVIETIKEEAVAQ